jgi:hypothetical protein
MRFPRSLLLSFAAVGGLGGCLLGGCLLVSLSGCHKQKPAPSIDGLAAALERSAEKTLAAPSLAGEQVVLTAQSGQIDTLAGQVVQAASAAGGAALRSLNAQGQLSILATIPDNNAEAFKAALRHLKVPMEKPSTSNTLIEVFIENAAAASPTP